MKKFLQFLSLLTFLVALLIGSLAQAQCTIPLAKNRAQKFYVSMLTATTGKVATGDAGNITCSTSCQNINDTVASALSPCTTAHPTEVGSTGVYGFALTTGESNCDQPVLKLSSSTSTIVDRVCQGVTYIPYTLSSGTAQAVAAGTITLDATDPAGTNSYAGNVSVQIDSASTGVGESHCIYSNNASTKVAVLADGWRILPTGTIKYTLFSTPNCLARRR